MLIKSSKIIFIIILIFLVKLCSTTNTISNNDINSDEKLTENEILFHLKNDKRYDEIISNKWSKDLALAYRDWAGVGYLSEESANSQLAEIKKEKREKKNIKNWLFYS